MTLAVRLLPAIAAAVVCGVVHPAAADVGAAHAQGASAPARSSKLPAKAKANGGEKSTRPPVEGLWDTPGGRIEIIRSAAAVKGTMLVPAEGAGVAVGDSVLEGTFFEDSFAGTIRLGVLAASCGASESAADALLLLTRSGKLVGGISSSDVCLGDLRSASFVRVAGSSPADRMQSRMVGPPQDDGVYDPRGHRRAALPGTSAALMQEAADLLGEGRFEKARAMFLDVLKKEPSLGEAYNGVGVTYYARNDLERAVEWYKRGLEASPGFGDLYYNLACAYSLLGRGNMALRYLRLAALKGYAEADMVDRDPDLDSLRGEADYAAIRGLFEGGARASTRGDH